LLHVYKWTDQQPSLRWWKVKVKGESQDTESPVGLVPAAYVEQVSRILTLFPDCLPS
jgi:hypothetical protein